MAVLITASGPTALRNFIFPDANATILTSLTTNIACVSATGTAALQGINNGGGVAVQGVVNSGAGVAGSFSSVAPASPAVIGSSTAYYAGLFYNITDLGSDGANANAIGLVAQSVYSNAFYAQQGAITGSGSTLARNNVYPALYITRVTANLNGHDYTRPVLTVEETTSATGGLFELIAAGGAQKFFVDNAGNITAKATSGTILSIQNTAAGDVNFEIKRSGGVASDWFIYLPTGTTEMHFYQGGERFIMSAAGVFNATGGYTVGAAAGIDASITTAGLVGKTITVTKGLITGFT